jgi:hypothetical protein
MHHYRRYTGYNTKCDGRRAAPAERALREDRGLGRLEQLQGASTTFAMSKVA